MMEGSSGILPFQALDNINAPAYTMIRMECFAVLLLGRAPHIVQEL